MSRWRYSRGCLPHHSNRSCCSHHWRCRRRWLYRRSAGLGVVVFVVVVAGAEGHHSSSAIVVLVAAGRRRGRGRHHSPGHAIKMSVFMPKVQTQTRSSDDMPICVCSTAKGIRTTDRGADDDGQVHYYNNMLADILNMQYLQMSMESSKILGLCIKHMGKSMSLSNQTCAKI